jgi:hypothetical protein
MRLFVFLAIVESPIESARRLDVLDCAIGFRCHAYHFPSLLFVEMRVFNGHATSVHCVPTWVWGGDVQPWRARSLP